MSTVKIYASQNYIYIDPIAEDKPKQARGAQFVEIVPSVHNSTHFKILYRGEDIFGYGEISLSDVRKEDGSAYTEEEFKNFVENYTAGFNSGGGSGIEGIGATEKLFVVERNDEGDIILVRSIYDLQVPPESIKVGETITISDLAQELGITTKYDGKEYILMKYEVSESGTVMPTIKIFEPDSEFDLQPVFNKYEVFTEPVNFPILSQQSVLGEEYSLKLECDEDIKVKVYRRGIEGEKILVVDEIVVPATVLESTLDLVLTLTPKVDFTTGIIYDLEFSTENNTPLKVYGTDLVVGTDYNGVGRVNSSTFVPYIKRTKGKVYTVVTMYPFTLEDKEALAAAVPYLVNESRSIALENGSRYLNISKNDIGKRIVTDAYLPAEVRVPTAMSPEDDGWYVQIMNQGTKTLTIGNYNIKKGGSSTIVYDGIKNMFYKTSRETNAYIVGIREWRVDVEDQDFAITEEMDSMIVNTTYSGNWNAALPDIDTVPSDFKVHLVHNQGRFDVGTVLPGSGDAINGDSELKLYGKGSVSIRKYTDSQNNSDWFKYNHMSYDDLPSRGITKEIDFSSQSTVTITHNYGYVPIVQVWVMNANLELVDSSVYVVHDWVNKNSFTINLPGPGTGKILYR